MLELETSTSACKEPQLNTWPLGPSEASPTPVDAGEHIGIIRHVIHQMGCNNDEADEAFSRGLVVITEAAMSYNPDRNVPVASWLAQNVRWDIQRMRRGRVSLPLMVQVESPRETLETTVEFREIINRVNQLPERERQVILASALGFSGNEIANKLSITPVAVSRIKKRVQEKLRN